MRRTLSAAQDGLHRDQEPGARRWPTRSIFPFVTHKEEHAEQPASSPGRPRRGRAEAAEPRRGFQRHDPVARRGSDCRKSLLTPRSGHLRQQGRGGECVQGEGEYASYHSGEGSQQETLGEPATLYQRLQEATGEAEGKTAAIRVRQDAVDYASTTELCARHASVLGFIESSGHEAENL
jgi:hypothetical protein